MLPGACRAAKRAACCILLHLSYDLAQFTLGRSAAATATRVVRNSLIGMLRSTLACSVSAGHRIETDITYVYRPVCTNNYNFPEDPSAGGNGFCYSIQRTTGTRLAIAIGLCLMFSSGFAQTPQPRFLVRFTDSSMVWCGAPARTYIDTHPNRSDPNSLTFSTYGAALQGAKNMPCDGFSAIRHRHTFHGEAYGGYFPSGISWNERAVTVVEDFQTHEPSVTDPTTGHRYLNPYGGAYSPVFYGDYDSRVNSACTHFCASLPGPHQYAPLSLRHTSGDRWDCICGPLGFVYGGSIAEIRPYCTPPMFSYVGTGTLKQGKCTWIGGVVIFSVNVDPGKSIDSSCPAAHPENPHAGNPINVAHGNKIQLETDYRDPRGLLDVTRVYASAASYSQSGWQLNWSAGARPAPKVGGQTGYWSIAFVQPSGRRIFFGTTAASHTTLTADTDIKDVLMVDSADIRLRRVRDGMVEHYAFDPSLYSFEGRLIRRDFARGGYVSLAYNIDPASRRVDRLTVIDHWGRSVELFLDSVTGRISGARLPGNEFISYDGVGRITLPDGSQRLYHYNEPQHTSGASFPYALTGISVQGATGDPVRFSTYQYDSFGRAISSEHAGGVNRYSVNYVAPYQQSVITDPLGSQRAHELTSDSPQCSSDLSVPTRRLRLRSIVLGHHLRRQRQRHLAHRLQRPEDLLRL